MPKRTCATCKHFLMTEPDKGVCTAHPPSPFPNKEGGVSSFFAPVSTSMCCGEYVLALEIATELPSGALLGPAGMQ